VLSGAFLGFGSIASPEMSQTGHTVPDTNEPLSRYTVTVTAGCDGGYRPGPAAFTVAAERTAWSRSAGELPLASSAGDVAVTRREAGRSMVAGRDAAWVADITRNDSGSTLIFDGMVVVWASVIAVLGTLGGATASYLFQGKISERNESKARDERLRQERLAAYSSFAGAVMDLRGIQYDRGYSRMTVEDHQLDRSSANKWY
jgi:hypothetical protein